jgi:hypothetical protein
MVSSTFTQNEAQCLNLNTFQRKIVQENTAFQENKIFPADTISQYLAFQS